MGRIVGDNGFSLTPGCSSGFERSVSNSPRVVFNVPFRFGCTKNGCVTGV